MFSICYYYYYYYYYYLQKAQLGIHNWMLHTPLSHSLYVTCSICITTFEQLLLQRNRQGPSPKWLILKGLVTS